MQLEYQVVIVTGDAAGIGGAISRVLVRRGAEVVPETFRVRSSVVRTGSFKQIAWYSEVMRCWPSRMSAPAAFPTSPTPSIMRSRNPVPPPAPRNMRVPTGYPCEIEASRLMMLSFDHT